MWALLCLLHSSYFISSYILKKYSDPYMIVVLTTARIWILLSHKTLDASSHFVYSYLILWFIFSPKNHIFIKLFLNTWYSISPASLPLIFITWLYLSASCSIFLYYSYIYSVLRLIIFNLLPLSAILYLLSLSFSFPRLSPTTTVLSFTNRMYPHMIPHCNFIHNQGKYNY